MFNVTVYKQFAIKVIIKTYYRYQSSFLEIMYFQVIRKYIITFFLVILLFIVCWERKQQSVKQQEVQMARVSVLMMRGD